MLNIDKRLEVWQGLTFSPEDFEKIFNFVIMRTKKDKPKSGMTFISIRKHIDSLELYLNDKDS